MTPDALLFDLDDTLVPEWEGIAAAYDAVARRVWGAGTPERTDALTASARAIWSSQAPPAYRRRVHLSLGEGLYGELAGVGGEARVLREVAADLHRRAFDLAVPAAWRGRSPELLELWRRARIEALRVYPETAEVLDHWARRVPLALVTNGASVLQRRKVAAAGLGRWLSVIVVSEEVGAGKPDPAIMHAALAQLGVKAAGAVMVGNDLERDVAGALAAGVRPIWIRRAGTDGAAPKGVEVIGDLRELATLIV